MSRAINVCNMKEMRDTLEAHLLKINDGGDDVEEKTNSKKIKTYIVEANIQSPKKISSLPRDAVLQETDDKRLFQIKLSKRHGETPIFLDASDERFWLMHSFGESKKIQDFMKELITINNSHLDYSWFSSNFLEEKCSIGTGEGFNIKYENSFLNNENDDDKFLRSFTMLFWGARPSEVISGLKKDQTLVSGVSLSRIKELIKTEDGYVKESIGRDGKFTLWKGDSIDSHLWAVENIKDKYSELIRGFEDRYRIKYLPTKTGLEVNGTYSLIEFNRSIENIEFFLRRLLSGDLPFRIFGFSQAVNEGYYKVNAVDLHTHDKFNMEVTPKFIRLYLYENSCGNVITRLMTNLQQHYDSQIALRGYDDERLL